MTGMQMQRSKLRHRQHAPIEYAICTFAPAKVHVAYFISAKRTIHIACYAWRGSSKSGDEIVAHSLGNKLMDALGEQHAIQHASQHAARSTHAAHEEAARDRLIVD